VHGRTISEIILVVYHGIGDGISAMYFLRDLLQGMQGKNLVRLPPRPSLVELVIHQGALPLTSPASGRSDAKLHRPCQPLILSFKIEPRQAAAIRPARAQLASAFDARSLQGRFARLSALLAAYLCLVSTPE
jgi:hypothetical protein